MGTERDGKSEARELAEASAEKERKSAEQCCANCEEKFIDIGAIQHKRGFILGWNAALERVARGLENDEWPEPDHAVRALKEGGK